MGYNEMHEYFPRVVKLTALTKVKLVTIYGLIQKDLKKQLRNLKLLALKLIKISQNKNIDDTVSSFREVAASCKGCHKQFRN